MATGGVAFLAMTSDPASHLGDLGAFIKDQRELARLSVRRLADISGVSNPYLSQIERGLRRPSADILRQIAQALRISAESLYVRAGILDERDGELELEVPDAIRRDPLLTDDQKRALLAVYEGFVATVVKESPTRAPG
jgi:transcriptional regulator with XRE-family HTH domain